MAIVIAPRRYFTKKDQFKTKEYVIIRHQDPESLERDAEGFYKAKRKDYSCGEVHNPKTWEKAEQRLRLISDKNLQRALDKLEEKKRVYIPEEED